ncbi:MAG: hypothetical protein JWM41_1662 [Gemmatimonadetes bacterium]|nr:hypothetical protein [Gemmatimonadota bacterium]
MFVPLVDILRCVNPHEETWLVASIERAEDRDILAGMLGCPTCLAEYPIRDGVVYFVERQPAAAAVQPSEAEAVRLAATLDLTDARMTAVLHGAWAAHAQLVRGMSPAELLLLNAPAGMVSGDGVSLLVADIAPLAQGSVDAVAVDATADAATIESLLRSLRGKGRMLGPVSMPIPDGLVELARDDEVWVARLDVKVTVSAPIALKRRDG